MKRSLTPESSSSSHRRKRKKTSRSSKSSGSSKETVNELVEREEKELELKENASDGSESAEDNDSDVALAGKLVVDRSVSFKSLGVDEALCSACDALGWKHPSDIQREALPVAIEGRDIIGLAETGSGKTAAFAIPILQALLDDPQPFYALVLAPTRELAFQISEQFQALGSDIGVKCAVLIGGMDIMAQAIQLANKAHVIIGTPGRVMDHLENTKGFSLRKLRCLVFDEADQLLNLNFEKEINTILQIVPRERRTYLYSATMTNKVAKLQRASLSNPVKVEVSRKYQTVKTLKQEYLFIPAKFKDVNAATILNDLTGKIIMVFVNTIRGAQRLSLLLRALGFSAIPLYSKMAQSKRLGALNKFKSGDRAILVATDVASRGLDIPHVDVVINYDIPTKSKDYIHRVGRTARAGRSGRAVSLVTQYDVELFQRIEQLIGLKMPQYPIEQDAAMLFQERVTDAQRVAAMEMKEQERSRKEMRERARSQGEKGSKSRGRKGSKSKRGRRGGNRF